LMARFPKLKFLIVGFSLVLLDDRV
jgi:hypothetical protein